MGIKKTFNEMSVLFPILTLYTMVYVWLMTYDFAVKGAFEMPVGMMGIYIALVAAYAADKEIRRWMGKAEPDRKGAIFVYLWLVLFLVAFIIHSFKREYTLPADMAKVAIQVLGIFFGAKASKKIYEKTKKKGEETIRRVDKIIEVIKKEGKIQRSDVSEMFKVSDSTSGRILKEMEKKGLIQPAGEGRGTHYILVKSESGS